MFLLMIVNFVYNFRDYGIKNIDNKVTVLAKTVEHSLTTQMHTGVIDQREIFLNQLEDLPNINNIWLSRSQKVIDMFGNGFNNELPKDDIDREVLRTGIEKKVIKEKFFSNSTYRITIPYKASTHGVINCMQCHTNAKEGDTLGAITIVIPIDDSKEAGISTIIDTTAIGLVLITIIGFLINYLISPFLQLFDSIKRVMNKAQRGDYSQRVISSKNKEARDVSTWVNTLLEKLETTLGDIDSKISIFLSNELSKKADPLLNVKHTVDRLSNVYKFRKTIEHDEDLNDIYQRLANVLKTKLNINTFNFLEADTRTGEVVYVYNSDIKVQCSPNLKGCRADKTNKIVDSSQFEDICKSCDIKESDYFCIPYSISNDLDLIISIYTKSEEELLKVRENVPFIDDYVDAAKAIIISNKLMNILETNTRTDPLTKLFNRKHLEEQIPKIISQAERSNLSFGVLMIDIDHFKKVNDTYGHDVGDTAIKHVAQTLMENTRSADVVIRFGGEEFIVLLYNCDAKYIESIGEKIRCAFLAKDIPAGNTTIKKTVSIGASMYPKDNTDLNACIKYSDLALYEAKNTGRNKVVMFTDKLLEKESI